MPLWLKVTLGAAIGWLLFKSQQAVPLTPSLSNASNFAVGQSVTVPAGTPIFSDAALTQSAGTTLAGGSMTVKSVDLSNNSLGVVGPTGRGLGSGSPAYVSASVVHPAGVAV